MLRTINAEILVNTGEVPLVYVYETLAKTLEAQGFKTSVPHSIDDENFVLIIEEPLKQLD